MEAVMRAFLVRVFGARAAAVGLQLVPTPKLENRARSSLRRKVGRTGADRCQGLSEARPSSATRPAIRPESSDPSVSGPRSVSMPMDFSPR